MITAALNLKRKLNTAAATINSDGAGLGPGVAVRAAAHPNRKMITEFSSLESDAGESQVRSQKRERPQEPDSVHGGDGPVDLPDARSDMQPTPKRPGDVQPAPCHVQSSSSSGNDGDTAKDPHVASGHPLFEVILARVESRKRMLAEHPGGAACDRRDVIAYDRVPVEDFGERLLRGLGWTPDSGASNKKRRTESEPHGNAHRAGLGFSSRRCGKQVDIVDLDGMASLSSDRPAMSHSVFFGGLDCIRPCDIVLATEARHIAKVLSVRGRECVVAFLHGGLCRQRLDREDCEAIDLSEASDYVVHQVRALNDALEKATGTVPSRPTLDWLLPGLLVEVTDPAIEHHGMLFCVGRDCKSGTVVQFEDDNFTKMLPSYDPRPLQLSPDICEPVAPRAVGQRVAVLAEGKYFSRIGTCIGFGGPTLSSFGQVSIRLLGGSGEDTDMIETLVVAVDECGLLLPSGDGS